MKEEEPKKGGAGLGIMAAGAMAVCCGGPLLIGSVGAIGAGSIMAFISSAFLPVSATLVVGGFGFMKYRSYIKRKAENGNVPSESITKSQS